MGQNTCSFSNFDTDQNGKIDMKEFENFENEVYNLVEKDKINLIFSQRDKDNSGYIERLEFCPGEDKTFACYAFDPLYYRTENS